MNEYRKQKRKENEERKPTKTDDAEQNKDAITNVRKNKAET